METKTAVKKELFFDQDAFNEHEKHLNGMLKKVDYLGAVWRDQKILSKTPFTTEHYHGIMSSQADYIEEVIYQMLKEQYEKLPGLTDHVLQFQRPKVHVDTDKLERIVQFLQNPGPDAPVHVRFDMIEIKKEKAVIKESALKELRERFTVSEAAGQEAEMLEKGRQAEILLNEIHDYMINKRKKSTADLGFNALPVRLQIFSTTKQPGQPWRSLFFKDYSGKIKFNARRLSGMV